MAPSNVATPWPFSFPFFNRLQYADYRNHTTKILCPQPFDPVLYGHPVILLPLLRVPKRVRTSLQFLPSLVVLIRENRALEFREFSYYNNSHCAAWPSNRCEIYGPIFYWHRQRRLDTQGRTPEASGLLPRHVRRRIHIRKLEERLPFSV